MPPSTKKTCFGQTLMFILTCWRCTGPCKICRNQTVPTGSPWGVTLPYSSRWQVPAGRLCTGTRTPKKSPSRTTTNAHSLCSLQLTPRVLPPGEKPDGHSEEVEFVLQQGGRVCFHSSFPYCTEGAAGPGPKIQPFNLRLRCYIEANNFDPKNGKIYLAPTFT